MGNQLRIECLLTSGLNPFPQLLCCLGQGQQLWNSWGTPVFAGFQWKHTVQGCFTFPGHIMLDIAVDAMKCKMPHISGFLICSTPEIILNEVAFLID